MQSTVPPATPRDSARQEALRWAARVRDARADLRRRLSAGEVTLSEVLVDVTQHTAEDSAADSAADSGADGAAESGADSAADSAAHTCTAGVRLLFVLESLPGARKVDTRRRLADLGIDPDIPIGDLDGRTRQLLLEEFPLQAPIRDDG